MKTSRLQPYYQDDYCTIYQGDCLDVLPHLSDVDLVVADPPYVFGLASTANEGKCGSWADLMNNSVYYCAWLSHCQCLTINNSGAAWVFNSWRSYPVLARASTELKWGIRSLLVWNKECLVTGSDNGLRPTYELVALFPNPGFSIANRSLTDIWSFKWPTTKPHGHPAKKPEALISKVIEESGAHTILDPFMGSGTTLAAAKALGRRAIGIEADKHWCNVAVERLNDNLEDKTE
ncbi:MAG: site-specific DNA-methyltransferase [Acidobacteriota bacterium]